MTIPFIVDMSYACFWSGHFFSSFFSFFFFFFFFYCFTVSRDNGTRACFLGSADGKKRSRPEVEVEVEVEVEIEAMRALPGEPLIEISPVSRFRNFLSISAGFARPPIKIYLEFPREIRPHRIDPNISIGYRFDGRRSFKNSFRLTLPHPLFPPNPLLLLRPRWLIILSFEPIRFYRLVFHGRWMTRDEFNRLLISLISIIVLWPRTIKRIN